MINWKIIREIFSIAVPAVGEMTLYMMIWILDTMMVGKYGGSLAVSSVGLCTEVIYSFFNMIIAIGVSTALTSLISRSLGAKNYKKAEDIANGGFKIALILAFIFFGILFFLPTEILKLAGATEKMMPYARRYAKISAFSFFMLSISSSINGVFRGVKDTKTSLYVAAIINIVNLSFDYLLIFGKFGFPELGVTGAAIATVLGNIAGISLQYSRLKKLPFKIRLSAKFVKKDIWEITKLAIPSGLQEGNFSISKLIGLTFIMRLGTVPFAANQIVTAIEAISTMPGWGIAIATTALVGHSVGAKNHEDAKEYTVYSAMIASLFMGVLAIIFFFAPKQLVTLFIQHQEVDVIKLGATCLQIGAFEQVPIAILLVYGAYFKGMGDTKTPFYASFVSNWFFRLPLGFYFIFVLNYPVYIFWVITVIQWILEGGAIYILYKKKSSKFYF